MRCGAISIKSNKPNWSTGKRGRAGKWKKINKPHSCLSVTRDTNTHTRAMPLAHEHESRWRDFLFHPVSVRVFSFFLDGSFFHPLKRCLVSVTHARVPAGNILHKTIGSFILPCLDGPSWPMRCWTLPIEHFSRTLSTELDATYDRQRARYAPWFVFVPITSLLIELLGLYLLGGVNTSISRWLPSLTRCRTLSRNARAIWTRK